MAETLPRGIVGAAIGIGAGIAAAYGLRPTGVRAVIVDVRQIVADPATPTAEELVRVECSALHEAAHSLVATADAVPTRVEEQICTVGSVVPSYTAEEVARQHGPRWAMAYWLLAGRACAYRPARRVQLRAAVGRDVMKYGYLPADLEALAAGVPAEEQLTDKVAATGLWAPLLELRLPDEQTRAAAVVAAGLVVVRNGG